MTTIFAISLGSVLFAHQPKRSGGKRGSLAKVASASSISLHRESSGATAPRCGRLWNTQAAGKA
jgi:hypothetical protein